MFSSTCQICYHYYLVFSLWVISEGFQLTGNFIFVNTTKMMVVFCVTSATHFLKLITSEVQKVVKMICSKMEDIIKGIHMKCLFSIKTICIWTYQIFKSPIWSPDVTSATWNCPYTFIQISNLFSISNEMQFVNERLKHPKYTFLIPARV